MSRPLPLLFAIAISMFLLATCAAGPASDQDRIPEPASKEFSDYWYQGTSELNRYELAQARYGELRNGDAVLVFVTEDFLTKEQVKSEGGSKGPRTSALKTNMLERFNTGIYDYSIMTSVFSPVDGSPVLKVTATVQDWCGQAFSQVNRRDGGYHLESRSYFESEGDTDTELGDAVLEDGLWNRIRTAPSTLPMGEVSMLPSVRYLRLMHEPGIAVRANAALVVKGDSSAYRMTFPSLDRTVEIRFATAFPHAVQGWSETRPDGSGPNARTLTTTARLTHQVMMPYWRLNGNAHDSLRAALGLPRMPLR